MNVTQMNWRKVAVAIKEDLRLFGWFCIAELMVWRALRSERKYRKFRRAHIRLVQGGVIDWRKS